jgi:hypothetical protein
VNGVGAPQQWFIWDGMKPWLAGRWKDKSEGPVASRGSWAGVQAPSARIALGVAFLMASIVAKRLNALARLGASRQCRHVGWHRRRAAAPRLRVNAVGRAAACRLYYQRGFGGVLCPPYTIAANISSIRVAPEKIAPLGELFVPLFCQPPK